MKCWVGAHSIENDGLATTVYFDAFQYDFLDDPLTAIAGAVANRVSTTEKSPMGLKALRRAAAKLWKPAVRVGLAIGTAGATEVAGAIVDAGLEASSKELQKQVDAFWKKEEGRSAAMQEFRAALVGLTKPSQSNSPQQKLIIVVDELDRCRPDFALRTLEVIKHFFQVPNVHFVLGVNLMALENSIKSTYGSGINAQKYLEKFITVQVKLPEKVEKRHDGSFSAIEFFTHHAKAMELPRKLSEEAAWCMENIRWFRPESLRQAERVLTEISLVPNIGNKLERLEPGYLNLLSALLIVKSKDRILFERLREKMVNFSEICLTFGIPETVNKETGHAVQLVHRVWATCLAPQVLDDDEGPRNLWGSFGPNMSNDILTNVIRDFVEPIQLMKK